MMEVTTVWTIVNCDPTPRVKSMTKNKMDQNGEIGSLATASGYAMKANPAPVQVVDK